jgi:dCTP deaminase
MFLSNRDIRWAIQQGLLIFDPPPNEVTQGYDEVSVDLHLDDTDKGARVWDAVAYMEDHQASVEHPELRLGSFNFKRVAGRYQRQVPSESEAGVGLVFSRGKEVVVKPHGFVLWTTLEWVGTPVANPQYICFVNAKSTRARTGVMVHMTAPTINAGWDGNITLEIANLGPFHVVLKPGDAIAQLTVATISSAPDLDLKIGESKTARQTDPSGAPDKRAKKPKATAKKK